MRKILSIILGMLLLLQYNQFQVCKGGRILNEKPSVGLQSLERGPVPPSAPSGCTHIPESSGTKCPMIGEMHVAGHGMAQSSAYPSVVVPVSVATQHY